MVFDGYLFDAFSRIEECLLDAVDDYLHYPFLGRPARLLLDNGGEIA